MIGNRYSDRMHSHIKKYLYSALFLGLNVCAVSAQQSGPRTVESRIADLIAQPPPDGTRMISVYAKEIASLEKPGIVRLVTGLSPSAQGTNGNLEYLIGGFTYFVNQPGREGWRKLAAEAYSEALPLLKDKTNQAFILSQLQQIDKGEGLKAIVPFLEDRELVGPAARALAKSGTAEAGRAMMKSLENPWGDRQLSLIEALGDMKFVEAVPVIERFAAGEEPAIRKVSQYALARIAVVSSEKVLADAAEKAGWVYETTNAVGNYLQYLNNLAAAGEKPVVEKASAALLAKAKLPRQRGVKIAALGLLVSVKGDAGIPLLAKAAESTDPVYRNAALEHLRQLPGAKTEQLMLKSLSAGTPAVKADILAFLGQKGSQEALPAILRNLNNASLPVKLAAVTAAGRIGGEGSIPKLLPLLKSGDTLVAAAVKQAILGMKGSSVTGQVASAIPGLPSYAKAAFTEILAARGAGEKLDAVRPLLTSPDKRVRAAAFSALKQMTSSKDLPELFVLLRNSNVPSERLALQEAVKAVIGTTGDAQQQTRMVTAELNRSSDKAALIPVLAGVGGKEALEAVAVVFGSGSPEVKRAALTALATWPDDGALAVLNAIGRAPEQRSFRSEVVTGLVKVIGRSKASPVQKVLELRNALELAETTEEKKLIIGELQKNKTFGSLITAGRFLDVPELQQPAARAVMSIALSDTRLYGTEVTGLLRKVLQVLQGQDSEYEKEAIRKYLSSLPADKGFASLFNGRDLTGWKGLVDNPVKRAKLSADSLAYKQKLADEKMRAGWYAENGVLVFNGKGNNICTEKQYGNFEMYVDWKLDADGKDGDAGIYLRGTPQVQIWDTSRVNVGAQVGSGGLYNNKVHPSIPLKVADNLLGEWNTFYIKMVGDRVTVDLNGERVVDNVILENFWDRKLPIFPVEQIELQAHGTKVYYRDIYVRELPSVKPFELSAREREEGFKVLFDGTNMFEWTGNTVDYFIEDGNLVIEPKGKGNGNLFTRDEYSDFIFRFEFQLTPGANNGLGIRAPLEGNAAYEGAAEIQILDDTAPVYSELEAYQYHGSVYGVIPAKRGYLKPVGEWNEEEVHVQGSRVKVVLNGTVIVDGDLKEVSRNGTLDKKEHPGLHRPSGHIGFLGHGTVVRFRNIRVKDLSVRDTPVTANAESTPAKKKGRKGKARK